MGDEKLVKTTSFSLKDKLKLISQQHPQQPTQNEFSSTRLLQPANQYQHHHSHHNHLNVNLSSLSHSTGSVATAQSHEDLAGSVVGAGRRTAANDNYDDGEMRLNEERISVVDVMDDDVDNHNHRHVNDIDDDDVDDDLNAPDDDLHNLNILCNDSRDLAADVSSPMSATVSSEQPPHMKSICKLIYNISNI